MTRLFLRQLRPWLLLFGPLLAGCGGDGGNGGTPPATKTIAKASASGDAQTGIVGQPLATPIQVVVTENGAPLAGETVTWSTTAPNASLTASSTTDANGLASSAWTLGTVSGSQTAQATLSGASGSPLSFTATASPGPATALVNAGGDQQNGVINTPLAAPLQAKASDQFGNGVAGVAVAWAITSGDASVSAPSVPTNTTGISAVNVTLGGTAGPITITAAADALSGSPLTFTATSTTAPTTTTINVVNDQFSPATITVAAGTEVTWTWGTGAFNHNVAPDGTEPPRSGNPVNAPNSYQHTFSTPGTYRYHCEVHGAAGGFGMSGTVIVQ
jgi:plastocyanin